LFGTALAPLPTPRISRIVSFHWSSSPASFSPATCRSIATCLSRGNGAGSGPDVLTVADFLDDDDDDLVRIGLSDLRSSDVDASCGRPASMSSSVTGRSAAASPRGAAPTYVPSATASLRSGRMRRRLRGPDAPSSSASGLERLCAVDGRRLTNALSASRSPSA